MFMLCKFRFKTQENLQCCTCGDVFFDIKEITSLCFNTFQNFNSSVNRDRSGSSLDREKVTSDKQLMDR